MSHAEDIEIGCGGTVLRLAAEMPDLERWIVFSGAGTRAGEARNSRFLENIAKKQIEVLQFRDGFFLFRAPKSRTASKPSNASSIRS